MIQLQIDPSSVQFIQREIDSKIEQSKEIIGPMALSEIAKAVFTITSKRFLQDLAREAIQNPNTYHHLYEWNKIGLTSKKLFVMKRSSTQSGELKIRFVPMRSTTYVPIPKQLVSPGPTGKFVRSRSIFREKMRIMEDDIPIRYVTKRKQIAYIRGKMIFIPKNYSIEITKPGGAATTGALKEYSTKWYREKAPRVVANSRLMKQIQKEVIDTINSPNSSKMQVQSTIKRVANAYGRELTEI